MLTKVWIATGEDGNHRIFEHKPTKYSVRDNWWWYDTTSGNLGIPVYFSGKYPKPIQISLESMACEERFVDVWYASDIRSIASDIGISLTEANITTILEIMEESYDADEPYTYTTIVNIIEKIKGVVE